MPAHLPATWSIVTFTADEGALGELASLQSRFAGIRFVAVVPTPLVAPGDVAVLVDQDGKLAAQLGVEDTRTFVMDGRGTVVHGWPGVPEHEAISVYAARPPLPSGAPAWLFPVLAAAVLIVGIAAWAGTRQPASADLASIPTAPIAVAPQRPSEVAPPAEAEPAADAADGTADAADAGGDAPTAPRPGPGARPGGRKGRTPPNLIGGWAVMPKPLAATIASISGDEFTLKAVADKAAVACRDAVPISGTLHFAAEWKLTGITGKPARLTVKQLGSDNKAIHDPAARTLLGRGKGSSGWGKLSAEVKPVSGAVSARMCLEFDPGPGSATIRGVLP